MARAILSAAGLGCLLMGVVGGAADEDRSESGQPVPANSPLPVQVWWTEQENTLVVNESGPERSVEIDVRTGKLARPNASRNFPGRAIAGTAANRKLWASIDPRLPAVQVFQGDFLDFKQPAGDREAKQVIAVADNPQALAFTPDSKTVLVACDPPGRDDRKVCLVEVATRVVNHRAIRGSSNLRGIAVDPGGKFALAVHLVHKSHLPSTQIEQGWVFTNAVTYLSLAGPPVTVTLPLDLRTQGFANPEGVAILPDGSKAYIAHAGADLVSVIDMPVLLDIVAALQSKAAATGVPHDAGPATGSYVHDDLRVTRRYVRTRVPVGANPRGIAVSPDGKLVAVANRLDDSVSLIDAASDSVVSTISLAENDDRPLRADRALVRQGEKLFHSGRLSFSGQFSCASCHPDAHADGLNWDLPADGFNNFYNTKSLLSVDGTAPYGWLGTSPTLRDRFTGTLRHLFQHEPTDSESAAIEAYLAQLHVPEAVHRPAGPDQLAIERGRGLFEGKAGCRDCHSGPNFTDRSLHDIGTGTESRTEFDTPALSGISTTAPYLHDGRAATLEGIFARHNPQGLHGHAADLAPCELADLVEYLKSL